VGDIRDIVPAVGEVRSASVVEVGAEVTGRIVEVAADFNDEVSRGDLLARIDPAPFEAALSQARAQLAIAQAEAAAAAANLEAGQAELSRATRLASSGAGAAASREDLEFRVRALEASQRRAAANVTLAEGRVRQSEIDLERTRILSPSDGFVLDRRIEEGQAVNAVQTAPTVFVIASDLSRVLIEAQVSETDIGRVTEGMDVRFTVDAYPRERFTARIEQIRRAPDRRGRFISYRAVLSAEDRFQRLLPGMTASVEFVASDARAVLRVPVEALYFRPEGWMPEFPEEVVAEAIARSELDAGIRIDTPEMRRVMLIGMNMGRLGAQEKRAIFVLTPDGPEYREVRIGAEDDTHVEIVDADSDLQPGEFVITGLRGS
jgi:HlyD family secretion protein